MPSIFKSFLKPQASNYVFKDADDISLENDEDIVDVEDKLDLGNAFAKELERAEKAEKKSAPLKEVSVAEKELSFAKIQAEKIIEDAKTKAEEMYKNALESAREEIDIAKDAATAEGYRTGYSEGLSKASVEAKSYLDDMQKKQAIEIKKFLEKASYEKENMVDAAYNDMCDLCISVAEKVIHVSLKSSKAVITRMILVATEKLKRKEWVRIYIGGVDTKYVAEVTPELMANLASVSDHIKVIPMGGNEKGTCIIEMPDEVIDASVSTQLQNIRSILNDR